MPTGFWVCRAVSQVGWGLRGDTGLHFASTRKSVRSFTARAAVSLRCSLRAPFVAGLSSWAGSSSHAGAVELAVASDAGGGSFPGAGN